MRKGAPPSIWHMRLAASADFVAHSFPRRREKKCGVKNVAEDGRKIGFPFSRLGPFLACFSSVLICSFGSSGPAFGPRMGEIVITRLGYLRHPTGKSLVHFPDSLDY